MNSDASAPLRLRPAPRPKPGHGRTSRRVTFLASSRLSRLLERSREGPFATRHPPGAAGEPLGRARQGEDAWTRGAARARAKGAHRAHVPPPRASGRGAHVLGDPGVSPIAREVSPRAREDRVRRGAAHGHVRRLPGVARFCVRGFSGARLVLGTGPFGRDAGSLRGDDGNGIRGQPDHTVRFAERFRRSAIATARTSGSPPRGRSRTCASGSDGFAA